MPVSTAWQSRTTTAARWIDRLRSALVELEHDRPDGYRPLHLFPGTEISVQGGVHLLAVFAGEATTSDIDTLLGAVGFTGVKGSSGDVTTQAFADVVTAIVQAGGIAIPAHVDGERTVSSRSSRAPRWRRRCAAARYSPWRPWIPVATSRSSTATRSCAGRRFWAPTRTIPRGSRSNGFQAATSLGSRWASPTWMACGWRSSTAPSRCAVPTNNPRRPTCTPCRCWSPLKSPAPDTWGGRSRSSQGSTPG